MPQKRLIVPDTSVVLPAYFRESLAVGNRRVDVTRLAQRLVAAIETYEVTAFAPYNLLCEFVTNAREKASLRAGSAGLDIDIVTRQVEEFFALRVTYIPEKELASDAWDLTVSASIPPPDSWYLACAMRYDAELWISHEHQDGFARNARAIHKKVFLLTEDDFDRTQ